MKIRSFAVYFALFILGAIVYSSLWFAIPSLTSFQNFFIYMLTAVFLAITIGTAFDVILVLVGKADFFDYRIPLYCLLGTLTFLLGAASANMVLP